MPRFPRLPSRASFGLVLAVVLAAASAGPVRSAPLPKGAKIVVLGFDGADPHLVEQYMDQGFLPHLAQLRDNGTYSPLGTTTPPQTPVSWSSFATGMNPGKNGIFDFLRRDLKTYQPDFAMYEIGSRKVLLGKENHFLVAGAIFLVALFTGLVLGVVLRRPSRGLTVGALAGIALAVVAALAARDLIPYRRPTVVNTRKGETFWELAGKAGIPTTVIRVPATFPPRAFPNGEILAGLGTPDIRGTFGTFSFYTTRAGADRVDENTEMGGKIIPISLTNGETDSYIYGPRNQLFDSPPDILPPLHLKLDREAQPPTVTVTACGKSQTVKLGEWSDWFTLEFKFSPIVKAYGMSRFFFVSADPFGLYMSPVNLDPHRPIVPVSAPPTFSRELAERFGTYKTLGWAMDTWALNELRINEDTFLQDVYFTAGKYSEIMRGLLDDGNFTLFVHVYELTDRVAHVFWRFMDPGHPAYDPVLAEKYGNAIRDAYVFMDKTVGEAMDRLGPNDLLFVCSDHGFHTWRRSVNYNTWLVRNGYMTLKSDTPDTEKRLEDLFGKGQFWPNVDWSRTKAYAMGLGDIYLNVKGREAQGIVEEGPEYERIRDQLITDLTAWIDPETGDHPVRRVLKRENVYSGYDPNLIPDLLVTNNDKYRVSWQTSLGGIPPQTIVDNKRKWSGDHCSLDPEITQGIFFSNHKYDATGVSILDFLPTILHTLGVPIPAGVDGKIIPEKN